MWLFIQLLDINSNPSGPTITTKENISHKITEDHASNGHSGIKFPTNMPLSPAHAMRNNNKDDRFGENIHQNPILSPKRPPIHKPTG